MRRRRSSFWRMPQTGKAPKRSLGTVTVFPTAYGGRNGEIVHRGSIQECGLRIVDEDGELHTGMGQFVAALPFSDDYQPEST